MENNGKSKFISVVCQSKWKHGCCERACAMTFPDIGELKEDMREALKKIIELCPMKDKLPGNKPIFK